MKLSNEEKRGKRNITQKHTHTHSHQQQKTVACYITVRFVQCKQQQQQMPTTTVFHKPCK